MNFPRRLFPVVCCALTAIGQVSAQRMDQREKSMVDRVIGRLLAEASPSDAFLQRYTWPPEVVVFSDPVQMETLGIDSHNAFATIRIGNDGEPVTDEDGRYQSLIGITLPLIREWVTNDPDALAYVLAHEMGHLLEGHVTLSQDRGGQIATIAKGRRKELDADAFGIRLALSAGYSKGGLTRFWKRLQDLDQQYCSIQHAVGVHPSWDDRLALIDPDQAEIWKSLSAFRTGVFLINVAQYEAARQCFEQVVEEFPEAAEVHANLGYATLLHYLDELKKQDLEKMDVAHIVPMGVLMRAHSLEAQLRGADLELWNAAVRALERALSLQPDLALAHANLGVAYLVHPGGKKLQEAWASLNKALQSMEGKLVAFRTQGAIFVNAAVTLLHSKRPDAAGGLLDKAEALFERELAQWREMIVREVPENERESAWKEVSFQVAWEWRTVLGALIFNRAVLATETADSDAARKMALQSWLEYLRNAPRDSVWWDNAWSRFEKLARTLGERVPPVPEQRATVYRPVFSVDLPGEGKLTLATEVGEIEEQLGEPTRIPVTARGSLDRLHYSEHDIELLADVQVLAIRLIGPKAPPVELRGEQLGGSSAQLRVGMPTQEMLELLGAYTAQDVELLEGLSLKYLPDLGIAIRFDREKVMEIAIVQVAG